MNFKITKAKSLTILVLTMFLFLEYFMFAPEELEKETASQVETQTTIDEQNDQVMKGIHVVATREERKEWELWSDEAIGIEKKGSWTLKVVKAIFFAEDGVEFTVSGDMGRFDLSTKNMRVSGDVTMVSSNGYTIRSAEIIYNSSSRILTSPEEVNIVGPKEGDGDYIVMRSDSMITDLTDSLIQLEGKVKAKKALAKSQKMSVISNKAHLSGKSYYARFIENVIMKLDEMRLSAPDAFFVYNNIKKRFVSLELSGGTKVSDIDKWVTAQKVKVYFDEKKYVFSGKPRVVQDQDELSGEKIIFYDGGKRVKVQGAKAKVNKDTVEKYE